MANHATTVPGVTDVSFYKAASRWGSGLFSWIFSTDHKKIGLMYLVLMLTFFVVGMTLGFLMRLELIAPGKTIVDPQTYNSLFTLHGVIMIFLFIVPGIPAILGNFILPLQLGADDVAMPRLNLLSYINLSLTGIHFTIKTE